MKFAIALLAVLVLSVSGSPKTRKPLTNPQAEEEWNRNFPEITNPTVQERIFKDGNEYRYLYDSQILTGMPNIHYQFSGARIRAVVKIQLGQKDLMQIEKVFFGSLHERFVSNPQTLIDLAAFEPLTEQDAPFEEALKKPIRFTYENGKINDFETTEDDPSWSINIKRAILSTFHLSLTEKEQPKDVNRRDPRTRQSEQTNQVRSRGPTPTGSNDEEEYFTVVEDGIAGRCEVSYLVLQIPNNDESIYPIMDTETPKGSMVPRRGGADSNVLNVTKTFDYRHCEFRPFIFKGVHLSGVCPTCETNPEEFFNLLESAAHTRYNITGTKEQYIIDSAVTEAVYKVTPTSHYAGSLVAYANVTMVLISSGSKKAGEINFPEQNSNKIDGLHMIDPKFDRREGDKYFYESPEADKSIVQLKKYWPSVEDKPRKVKVLFQKMLEQMEMKAPTTPTERKDRTEHSDFILPIIHFLEFSFAQELEQIHNEIKTINVQGIEKEEIEHLFIDLLVATGSNCTFTYLKKLLIEKKIEGPVVLDALTLLPFKMDAEKVGEKMIEEMLALCEHESMQGPFVKRSCWLSLGSLIHKGCAHRIFDARVAWKNVQSEEETRRPTEGGRPRATTPRSRTSTSRDEQTWEEPENLRCPVELRRTIVDKITSQLKSAKSDEDKILIIKTLGNMGLEETIDELEVIIEDPSVPIYVRTQAIYALRHIAPESPEDVLEILLPLYRQTKNPTQIRIAAFVIMMAAKPDLPMLQDIAQSLNRELDLDVASYVYSAMTTMANSTDPCLKNVTRDLRLALHLTTPVNTEWRHSKALHRGAWIDHRKTGLFWETSVIADKDAPVFRAANFRLHSNFMQKSMEMIEFGYETEGFGDMMRKYSNFTKEALADVLAGRASRHPREARNTVESIDEIDRLLNLKPQEAKEIRGTAYMKIFGQETRFAVINPQTISRFIVELISQSQSVIPKLFGEGLTMDNRRAMLPINRKLEFPTVLGVPIGSSARMPVTAGMKGKVKVVMEPKPADGMSFFKSKPEKIVVDHQVKTRINGELQCKLSVFLGFLKIGTGVRTTFSVRMPTTGKLEFNKQDFMTKLTMDLPENPVKLVHIQTYPVTYVWRLSNKETTYQPKEITARLRPEHADRDSNESGEEVRRRDQMEQKDKVKFVDLDIDVVETDMLTESGHVTFPKFAGVPFTMPEIWEIPTPAFIKSRESHLQVGHESMAFKVDIKSEMQYPNNRVPMHLLPVVGAKVDFKVKLTPKKGQKNLIVTLFHKDEYSEKTEKELLTKLKEKVHDMTVKDLERPNTIKDWEKFPKLGHSLQILVNAEGNDAPNVWTSRGLLAVMYSMDGRYVKFVAGMESKLPVFAKKFCLSSELRYPDRTGMWFVTPQETFNQSIHGNLEASWGDDCGSAEKMIKMRLRVQKTDEQMKIEKNDLYDIHGIPIPYEVAQEVHEGDELFTSLYKECEEDRQRGAFFSKPCVDFAVRYADLLRLKVDIEYKNVSPSIRKVLHKMECIAKGVYHWNTEVDDIDVKNPENRINAVIDYSADRSYVDIKYRTPQQNVRMINIDLPYDTKPASALFPWTPARLVGLIQFPTCTLSGPKITTFDFNSYEMPLSQCFHVLAKDNTENNLFAVLVANAAKDSVAKKLVFMIENHRIEIVPKGAVPTGNPSTPVGIQNYVVKYNGQEVAVAPGKRNTIPPNTPEDKQEVADVLILRPEVTGNKENILAIVSRPLGLKVMFDGSSVTIVPSPFWKGDMTGLCGSYNGEQWDDMLLPNKTMVETQTEVSRAFLLETQGCDKEITEMYTTDKRTPMSRRA